MSENKKINDNNNNNTVNDNDKIAILIRTPSLSDKTLIASMEMYMKNGYTVGEANWNSDAKCFVIKITK